MFNTHAFIDIYLGGWLKVGSILVFLISVLSEFESVLLAFNKDIIWLFWLINLSRRPLIPNTANGSRNQSINKMSRKIIITIPTIPTVPEKKTLGSIFAPDL